MSFQPGAAVYTQGFGTAPIGLNYPVYFDSAPTTANVYGPSGIFQPGQRGIVVNGGEYILLGFSQSSNILQANWAQTTSSGGDVLAVVGTANQVTVNTVSGTATVSLPSAIVTPGSLTTTTTLTATLGDVTATNGNFVSSAAGKGLSFNATTASGAASGPVVLNTRAGNVTFTSVSIAAAADLTLTMTNSSITSSSTQIIYSLAGATTGSALSVKSVTPGSGTVAFVITNGTGATTTTADISITFLVVN